MGRIARELRADGVLGPIFRPQHTKLKGLAFAAHGSDDPEVKDLAVPFRRTPAEFPRGCPKAIEGHPLCERTVWRAPDGKIVLLARDDTYSHRMYVSIYDEEAKKWPPAYPTNIPDSPSKTTNVQLEDATVLLIGNQMAPEFDNGGKARHRRVRHYGRDPLTVAVSRDGYHFTKVFAFRCGQQQFRVPRRQVLGRGGGAQYPDALVRNGTLYVLYSMGKEDICFSWVPIEELGTNL